MRTLGGLLVFLAAAAMAQTEAPSTEFEVASIKPFVPPAPGAGRGMVFRGRRGGPGTSDPGEITWGGTTVKALIPTAYGVKNYQVVGPEWLDQDRWTITAKVPPGTTKEQVLVMWQNLLAERFGLKLHRETKDIPIYEVTVAKGGLKMKESAPVAEPPKPAVGAGATPPSPPPPRRLEMGPDGCPMLPAQATVTNNMFMMMMPGRMRVCAQATSIGHILAMLSNQLNRPIIDKTGLTGNYDFRLEFEPEGQAGMMMGPAGGGGIASASQSGPPPDGRGPALPPGFNEPAPPIAAAFQNQLGLKLEAKKAPAEILIIDKLDRTPVDN